MQSQQEKKPLVPQPILDLNYAFAKTAIMIAAVRLHLFTHLANGPLSATEVAAREGTLPHLTERLLEGVRSLGLVERVNESYSLTPVAEQFLVEGKPSYLGGDTLAMLDYIPAWLQLDTVVRTQKTYRDTGNPVEAEAFFAPRVLDLFPLVYPVARRTAAELDLGLPDDAIRHILDVGAGSSPWGVAFAQRYPAAQVTALDLPAVVVEGQKQVTEVGLTDRYTWIAEDMEKVEYPENTYDLIFVGHVCRFIGQERSIALLKRLARSLRSGGTLLVADAFFTDDRQGPPAALNLDLSMMVNTAAGGVWTCRDIISWLGNDCGLREARRFHVAGPFPVVVAHKERIL